MRIFVTGAEGQVARALREAASGRDSLDLHFGGRPDLDLGRPESVRAAIVACRPDLVVNTAAYTAVDRAEDEPHVAFQINGMGARNVASAALECGAPIMQLSTDYVFDGLKAVPYTEADMVGPQGIYGQSKLVGEKAVSACHPKHMILRTAWVYSPYGSNFVRTMVRLATERDRLNVVNDQFGCPTYAPAIAENILAIALKVEANGWLPEFGGVTHMAGPKAMSWCDFAKSIMAGIAERGGPKVLVAPITTADFPTRARRPANSRLDTGRMASVFGYEMPPFEQSLNDCLDKLIV